MCFLMESKKRDLSSGSKSRNGEDSKVIEDYGNIISMPDDVFANGLSSLGWAKILVNCFRNIERHVNELHNMYENTKNPQIKGKKQLQSVTESLEFLYIKFDTVENERGK